jgi:hypothetical protein
MKSGRHRGKYNVESGMVEEVKVDVLKGERLSGVKSLLGALYFNASVKFFLIQLPNRNLDCDRRNSFCCKLSKLELSI